MHTSVGNVQGLKIHKVIFLYIIAVDQSFQNCHFQYKFPESLKALYVYYSYYIYLFFYLANFRWNYLFLFFVSWEEIDHLKVSNLWIDKNSNKYQGACFVEYWHLLPSCLYKQCWSSYNCSLFSEFTFSSRQVSLFPKKIMNTKRLCCLEKAMGVIFARQVRYLCWSSSNYPFWKSWEGLKAWVRHDPSSSLQAPKKKLKL